MPRPKALPIQPTRNPKPPALIRVHQRPIQTLLPRIQIPPHIQHHLRLRIRRHHLRGKNTRRRIRHRDTVPQQRVKLPRGNHRPLPPPLPAVNIPSAAGVPLLPRQSHPARRVHFLVVHNVPPVVGVIVAEVEQGLLEGLGARAREADAEDFHWAGALARGRGGREGVEGFEKVPDWG